MDKHFEEYTEILSKIKELYFNLETVNSRLYGVSGVSYEEKTRSTAPNNNTLYLIAKKDELEKKIAVLNKRREELYQMYICEINKVQDSKYRLILRCWYLHKNSSDEISKMLDITNGHFFKLKRLAVEEFKLKNDIK